MQSWVLSHQHPAAASLFTAITIAGGITAMQLLAVVAAAYLAFRVRRWRCLLVLLAPAITFALLDVVKRFVARPRPAGLGHGVDDTYSFPSAHATTAAAVCCTLAYAFWREGLIGARTAIAFAIVPPLLVGLSRVYLNVHWATDVLGGWSAGLLAAALPALVYRYIKEEHG